MTQLIKLLGFGAQDADYKIRCVLQQYHYEIPDNIQPI